ncbi:MAG: DMT family transporter [Acidobacteriota bacterium]
MNASQRAGVLALLVVTALWGLSFPTIGGVVGGRSLGDLVAFLALRFGLATIAFAPVLRRWWPELSTAGRSAWLFAAFIGLLNFLSYALQTVGLQYTTPGRSAFITMLSVPLVPFVSAALARRRPSWIHVAGALVSLIGLGFILAPDGELQPNVGDLLTFGCAVAYCFVIVFLERATRRHPVSVVTIGQIATVALYASPALVLLPAGRLVEWDGLGRAVLITGLLCTTLALGLMTWACARVSAEVAAILFALEPLWAVFFEWLFWDGTFSGWQWLGAVIVIAAVVIASRAPVPEATTPADASSG